MVINTVAAGKSGYHETGTETFSSTQYIWVTLPAKPKIFVCAQASTIRATGRMAYAVLDEETGDYTSAMQRNVSGGTVAWVDTSNTTIWNETRKELQIRVVYSNTSGTVVYDAVG